jgi:Zn-dependent protease with chaperone function
MLAAALWALSAARGVRAAVLSARHTRGCERLGRLSALPGSRLPVWILDAPAPLLALVGVWHSRVAISSAVVSVLPAGQLAAALRHEEAHRASRDNGKRLLLLLAPGLLPGWRGFGAIERGWARFAEWAADDDAVAGDPHLSLSLAAALVRIARLGGSPPPSPLASSFLGDGRDISVRVNRLLNPAPAAPLRTRNSAAVAAGWMLAAGCAACMMHPATLQSAHRLVEQLIH